jgi:hypothetical protein
MPMQVWTGQYAQVKVQKSENPMNWAMDIYGSRIQVYPSKIFPILYLP